MTFWIPYTGKMEENSPLTYKRICSLFKIRGTDSVLDYGCGTCWFEREHLMAVGMEKDKTLVEKAKKEGLVVYDNFAKIRWKFDVVFSNDVLEHLTEIELQHALNSMIKRIASGGRLILKWSTTQKDDFYKYNTGKTGHDHCCPWPLNYVKQLLKSKGLKIEESGKGWKLFRGSLRLPFWLQRILIPKSNDEAYIIAKR